MSEPTEDRNPDFIYESDVMTAISAERLRQGLNWTPAHDFGHSAIEWAGLITKYAGRYIEAPSHATAQHALIQVAAICVAAVEAIELSRYGPNPASALNALALRKPQDDE